MAIERGCNGTNEPHNANTAIRNTKTDNAQRTPGKHGTKSIMRNWGSGDTACGIIITSNSPTEAQNGATDSATAMDTSQHIHFPMAGSERNRDFHAQFENISKDEDLIEDYSCALQKDILVHGRLYVSQTHISFSSNILGWTTTLRMGFDKIQSVEKRNTALIFKNGLRISIALGQHVFASLHNRDAAYDLITNLWSLADPLMKSSALGIRACGIKGERSKERNDFYRKKSQQQQRQQEQQEGEKLEDEVEEDDDDEDEKYISMRTEEAKGKTPIQSAITGKTSTFAAGSLLSSVFIALAVATFLLQVCIVTRAVGFRGEYQWDSNIAEREIYLRVLGEAIRVAEEKLTMLEMKV